MAQASAKNFSILGLLKRKCDLSVTKWAVGKDARASFAKSKRTICPDHQIVRCEKEREPHIGDRGGSERVDSTVKKGRFREENGGQAKRASPKK